MSYSGRDHRKHQWVSGEVRHERGGEGKEGEGTKVSVNEQGVSVGSWGSILGGNA